MTQVNLKPIRKRFFEGKTEGFESKQEANFEKKHLEAYLRGDQIFNYGKDANGEPKRFKVKQRFEVVEMITSANK